MLREWFEFAFECFESLSNGSKFHLNASNPFQVVRIWIQILRILSNGSNLDSNASNPFQVVLIWIRMDSNPFNRFRMVQICFQMLRFPFEWLEFGFKWFEISFECFESLSSG